MGFYASIGDWQSEKGCDLFFQITKGLLKSRGDNIYEMDDQHFTITDIEVLQDRVDNYQKLVDEIKKNPDEYIYTG